ncbi:MAG: hypothetical protein NXI16_18475, partial [Alphaproteobacteria bacterium]|nr:hypothetical protein [Alphaproteobacteria bacterium]
MEALPHETAQVLGGGTPAEDPLEAALAELEKVKERPPAKKIKKGGAEKRPAARGPQRKPAARGSSNLCAGRGGGLPCIYNLQQPGERANYNTRGGANKCVFCDDALMRTACSSAAGRSNILGNLKKLRVAYQEKPHVYNSGLLRTPDSCREELHAKAVAELRPRAAARQERRAQPNLVSARTAKTSWAAALASRKRAWRPLTAAEAKKHKRQVKADRERVQTKFFKANDIEAPPAQDIADNDAGLPAPKLSEQGRFV